IFLDLETAASLINFGALIAFTFVNLAVISHYVIKMKRYKSIKDFINYLVFPIVGAGIVVILWVNLDIHSLILGIIWSVVGMLYLMYITNWFRSPVPQMHMEEVHEL
ncbi:MAG TPA: Putrescine importer PuuP, partial [Pseudobacillus sp.]